MLAVVVMAVWAGKHLNEQSGLLGRVAYGVLDLADDIYVHMHTTIAGASKQHKSNNTTQQYNYV